jgi:heme-degrading monooxygenase HmoA
MIARVWRGWTRREDADVYAAYVEETGLIAYRSTPGNAGAWLLRRDVEDRTEIVTFSFWHSWDAVRAFAGEDVERAVFYPEDDRFLVARDDVVTHYAVEDEPAPG